MKSTLWIACNERCGINVLKLKEANVCEPNYNTYYNVSQRVHINVELRKSCNQLNFYTEEKVTQQGLRELKG